jgi:hypothetical protein
MKIRAKMGAVLVACLAFALGPMRAGAADKDADAAREEMQKALNKEVMASPFNAGDINKATAYALDAKKQGLVPVPQGPTYWQPGWTCANMTVSPYYSYSSYRNCVYYHHYYGRYWR